MVVDKQIFLTNTTLVDVVDFDLFLPSDIQRATRTLTMDLPYNTTFNVGDHLILELNTNEIFEGDYSDGGKNRIELVNTRQHNNTNQLGGVYCFYRNEINKIYKPKDKVVEKLEKTETKTDSECNKIKIVEEEYNRLKQMSKQAIYLEHADSRYYEAVDKLNEAETIGLVSLGMEDSRTAILRLLVICTWKQIYIFDLANFKNRYFYPELKDIFESEYITKVIHGGGPLIDILYRNYNVYVQNIFDTQVVDLVIEKNKNGSSPKITKDISECLVEFLNFPPSLLKDALAISPKKWMERPLSEKNRTFAAQLATYLILLREQMQKKLLSKVYKAIDDVNTVYYNLSNYEFAQIIQNNKVTKEIEEVIP